MTGKPGRNRDDFGPNEDDHDSETEAQDSSSQVDESGHDEDEEDDEDYRPAPKPKKKSSSAKSSSGKSSGKSSARSSRTKLPSAAKQLDLAPEGRTVFFDLPYNGAAALCYLPLVPGLAAILWIFTENQSNKYLRFHCVQSLAITVLLVGISVLIGTVGAILDFIPVIGGPLSFILLLVRALIAFIFMGICLNLMFSVYRGKETRLPFVAQICDRFVE